MNWRVEYLPEAVDDLRRLDGSQRLMARKAIQKVSRNPLPIDEGGYGKPLGSKGSTNLVGFQKIKLRNIGLRIVYKVIRENHAMLVIVVGARVDDEVYEEAQHRIIRHEM